jgi:ATP dependent DNA ligase domain
MLVRSGQLQTSGDYAYEVKWDGFRAVVSTEGALRVRSRRGWDMTEHVPFLAQLPVRAVLDGELVALDEEGKPDFPALCECVLMRRSTTPLTFMVFDVLFVEGEPVTSQPFRERRRILEGPRLDAVQWRTPEASTPARPSGPPSASTSWRASSPSGGRAATPPRARLDQDEEPRVLALGDGARGRIQLAASAAVRLSAQQR